MKKILNKSYNFALWLMSIVTLLAIGGLFVGGSLTGAAILNFFPLIVHKTIGYIAIIVAIAGIVMGIMKVAK